MKEMEVKVQSTEDPAKLDRILTILMQASASMDATSLDPREILYLSLFKTSLLQPKRMRHN